jgi:hypothetical protein
VPEWALPQKAARTQPVVALKLGGFNLFDFGFAARQEDLRQSRTSKSTINRRNGFIGADQAEWLSS